MKKYINLIDKFENKNVLVIGDAMLDEYIRGRVERISPEAPVPVVIHEETSVRLGGAANVASNVLALNATASLLTIIGEDENGSKFIKKLEEAGIDGSYVYRLFDRPTIKKTRIIAGHQQVVRIDTETDEEIDPFLRTEIIKLLYDVIPVFDAIVISDYGKGVLNMELIPFIIERAIVSEKPVIVDPKPKNALFYEKATLLTPNRKEAEEMSGIKIKDKNTLESAGNNLLSKLDLEYLLITLGENGMALFEKEKKRIDIPARARSVYDVTGAGDLVASVMALCFASGISFADSANIANVAAGLEVAKLGNVSVSKDELIKELKNNS